MDNQPQPVGPIPVQGSLIKKNKSWIPVFVGVAVLVVFLVSKIHLGVPQASQAQVVSSSVATSSSSLILEVDKQAGRSAKVVVNCQ